LGEGLKRVLTDKSTFDQARELWAAGEAAGPEFAPERAIVRSRSIEVPKLRPIFDILPRKPR
jgi:hypothetical protein